MSAIAAAIDYGVTPKRLTPGWELVLSKSSMAAAYGAMALGLGKARRQALFLAQLAHWPEVPPPSRAEAELASRDLALVVDARHRY